MNGAVKGWCPSAYRPMMSGDGLLVRVKPRLGRLSLEQVRCIATVADRFGNGVIDLTSRANIQLRGIGEADHVAVLGVLQDAALIDKDPIREARRSILVTPFWATSDLTQQLATALEVALLDLPDMPDKIGFAVDAGAAPLLRDVPADFRFEQSKDGGLILVADGAARGVTVTLQTAVPILIKLARWFVNTGGAESGRLARHLARVPLPDEFAQVERSVAGAPVFDAHAYGVPFGSMRAADLMAFVEASHPSAIRVTPWRMLILEGGVPVDHPKFVRDPMATILAVSACPGAPACASASVATRPLAAQLVGRTKGALHVSGCAKGCARSKVSDVTLVGRDGRFDLVQNGRASDMAERKGLSEAEVLELFC